MPLASECDGGNLRKLRVTSRRRMSQGSDAFRHQIHRQCRFCEPLQPSSFLDLEFLPFLPSLSDGPGVRACHIMTHVMDSIVETVITA